MLKLEIGLIHVWVMYNF